jgi:MFS superfamily sulfate permease-like transporter
VFAAGRAHHIPGGGEGGTREAPFVYVHVDHHPEAELIPGILVVGMHGPLFFADADNFRNAVTQHVNSDHPYAVVVEFSAVTIMEMDGIRALSQLTQQLHGKHVRVLSLSESPGSGR